LTASAPAANLGRVRLFVMNDTLADPRLGVQALVATRHPEPVDDGAATVPAKAVDANRLAAAIDAYTSTPAWAASDEHRRGRIAKDMLADIVILSTDVFKLPADQLVDATVTMTIFDGKVVYDRAAEPPTTDQ
jgi:predicted amidohydrolase YtcJ